MDEGVECILYNKLEVSSCKSKVPVGCQCEVRPWVGRVAATGPGWCCASDGTQGGQR